MIREELLALADELEAFEGDTCERCAAYEQPECRFYLPCTEIVSKYCARLIRDAVERDGEGATTVSAYDLLSEDEREAIAWVRERGGLDAVEKRLMPEGMEWPTVDGKPVDFKTVYVPSLGVLEAVSIYNNGACDVMSHDGIIKSAKDIHIENPEVLDADGAEIREGDVLYSVETGDYVIVDSIEPGNPWFAIADGALQHCSKFTHRAPVLAADGKPLEVGQTVWRDDGEMLEVLYLRPDGLVDCCGEIERPERLTHERPVLDADGVEVRVGDTVYVLGFGEPLTVKGFTDDGRVLMSFHDENSLGYKPSKLTHEQPDTWERLEHDAEKTVCEYFGANYDCANCPLEPDRCDGEAKKDIIRRAKKLAERVA